MESVQIKCMSVNESTGTHTSLTFAIFKYRSMLSDSSGSFKLEWSDVTAHELSAAYRRLVSVADCGAGVTGKAWV